MTVELLSSAKCFSGKQQRYRHYADSLNCAMNFSIFLPAEAESEKVPVLYWLSGLTCTDENFVQKAGAQQFASKYKVAIVAPDTSPRGDDVADDPDEHWDFGLSAGFYLNATEEPYKKHYQMYDYILELFELVSNPFSIDASRAAISGHSMGGHGAISIGLKNQDKFKSISAFSPIIAPMQVPWGKKAFALYLGDNQDEWQQYDSLSLLNKSNKTAPILIEQGLDDNFLSEQLRPELLEELIKNKKQQKQELDIQLNLREGYDHSYFFIASFIESHIKFHCDNLS